MLMSDVSVRNNFLQSLFPHACHFSKVILGADTRPGMNSFFRLLGFQKAVIRAQERYWIVWDCFHLIYIAEDWNRSYFVKMDGKLWSPFIYSVIFLLKQFVSYDLYVTFLKVLVFKAQFLNVGFDLTQSCFSLFCFFCGCVGCP